MKKLLAGALSTALALVGLGVVTAAPAAAIEQSIGASCSSLDVYLWDVPEGTELTVTVDGEIAATEPVLYDYSRSFPLDWSQPHDWTVVADVPEGAGDDVSESGTTEPCTSDPNITADAWTSCQDVTASVMGYPAESRVTVVVDGATLVDELFDGSYYTTQSLDWTIGHTWSVTVDAGDDTLDRSWDGETTACDSDPNVGVSVNAWCGMVDAWGWGYPVGSQAWLTVDGQVLGSATVDEWGSFSLSAQPDPAVDFGWQVTVQDPAGTVLGERSEVVTGCAPSVPSVVSGWSTCSVLSVYVDVASVEPGSSVEVQVDGEVIGSEVVDGYFYRDFDLAWDAAHSWTARVVAPDGSEVASESGVSEPCASDPSPPLMVRESCGGLWVEAQDAVFTAGSRFELIVDGEIVSDEEFESYASGSTTYDHLLSHTYAATATAPDGTVFEATGTTAPCTQGDNAVHVTTGCEAVGVNIYDAWLGEGARVRLDVDGVTVLDEAVVHNQVDTAVAVDQTVDHEWTLTLDAMDDIRDWTQSGTTESCPWGPIMVAPVVPEPVTACDATPADVVLPASTEAITYTVTPDGLVATANPGYAFSWILKDPLYSMASDSQALLYLSSFVRPHCQLSMATATPVCDAGIGYLEYAVAPPVGAIEEQFYIDVEGPDHGYDTLWGDPGFGHPFAGRFTWRELVTNSDGTVSDAAYPSIHVPLPLHVHFHLYVPIPYGEGGSYDVAYEAEVPLTETDNPCTTSGGGDDAGSSGQGHAFGRDHIGHPVLHDHPVFGELPGQGVVHHHS